MFDMEWNEQKLSSFYNKMDKLIKELPNRTKKGVENAMDNVQSVALKNKRGSKDKKLIPIEIVDFDKNEVVGRIYTNKDLFSFAVFMEFGTGTEAEMPHIGRTKTFLQSGYQYWLLPVEKTDRQYNEDRIVNIKGKLFYIMYATKPYPFMRPSAFQTRKESANAVNEEVGKLFKEVLK